MRKSTKQQSIKRQSKIYKLRNLIRAIKSQDEDYIDNVTTKNVNINDNYLNDGTPLHVAARVGNYKIFQKLIKIGADIHKRHQTTQETVLDSAMEFFNYDIVRYLEENGVEKSDRIEGETALQFTAVEGTKEVMMLILAKIPDINIKFDDESTPRADFAAISCDPKYAPVIEFVLDLFFSSEEDGDTKTIFHAAADIKNHTVLKNWLISFSRKVDFIKDINFHSYLTQIMCYHNYLLRHRIAESDSVFQSHRTVKYGMYYIMRHIVELLAAGLYVSDRNIKVFCKAERFDGFLAECLLEVEKMKKNVIEGSNITFIEILHKNVRYSARYLKIVDLNKILIREPLFPEYPIYENKIYFKLWKTQIRVNYVKDSEEVIYNIFYELQLPDTFIRELYIYLSNDDLKEIIKPSRYKKNVGKSKSAHLNRSLYF
ncbi:uncharacterized protein LOC130677468 [Microplitis mediator]|uniref:uncharacterized protein LOC130677468 n=1 Tax=Microplitis mediator TaxID=375433 RepID=UPI002554B12A|nr:uncharacterized protein LOC130677468 [Microplitis mediator]